RRIDEDRLAVTRHGEPLCFEVARKLAGFAAEPAAEPLEEALGMLLLGDVDPDPPVVVGHVRVSVPAHVCTCPPSHGHPGPPSFGTRLRRARPPGTWRASCRGRARRPRSGRGAS